MFCRHQKIRSIDPTGKIAGPNFSYYDSAAYSHFMTFAKNNNVLPDVVVKGFGSAASGGKYVGWIGAGAANTLQFNNVSVPAAGLYRMAVTYANGELGAGASNYNTNIVDRYAQISVNGGNAQKVYFRNTMG